MKKLFITGTKAIFFFVGWAVLAGLLPIPDSSNGAVWRFWAELIPFLCVVGLTLIFWLMEKNRNAYHLQAIQKCLNRLWDGCPLAGCCHHNFSWTGGNENYSH